MDKIDDQLQQAERDEAIRRGQLLEYLEKRKAQQRFHAKKTKGPRRRGTAHKAKSPSAK